jgi:hypothetical protein
MKAYGGVKVHLHAFLTSALDGGEWSASRPAGPGTHWIGSWVGPGAVPDAVVRRKIPSAYRNSKAQLSSP